ADGQPAVQVRTSVVNKKTGGAIEAIRLALACEEFAKAQSLWTEHASQLRQAILDGSATQAMLSETRELIGWSRLVVLACHGHAGRRYGVTSTQQLQHGNTAGRRELPVITEPRIVDGNSVRVPLQPHLVGERLNHGCNFCEDREARGCHRVIARGEECRFP